MGNLHWIYWLVLSLFCGVLIAFFQAFVLQKILIAGQKKSVWLITFSAYVRWLFIGLLILVALQKDVVYGIISAFGVMISWQTTILLPRMRRLVNGTSSDE